MTLRTSLAVGSWVETPEGLGKVLRFHTTTLWIFRRAHREVRVDVRLIDGERRSFRPDQLGDRP